ncbi:MAG: VanZ family protein [bacterium]
MDGFNRLACAGWLSPSNIQSLAQVIKRKLLIAAFIVYIGVVAAVTIVPTHLSGFKAPPSYHINSVPFGYSFKCYRNAWGIFLDLKTFCLMNTFGNLALLLPLGILLPLISHRFRTLKRVLLFALCLSVGIEAIQFVWRFFGNLRAVDIDDVILNTLGACLGFAFYKYGIQKTEDSS